MIEAELPDGTVLEFPDGTADDVVDRAVKQHLGQPPGPANPVAAQISPPPTEPEPSSNDPGFLDYLQVAKPFQDAADIYNQGVERTDSFPYFRLPDSVGERSERSSKAALNVAPFAMGGGPVAAGLRGVAQRSAASGASLAGVDAAQQLTDDKEFNPKQTAAAAALGAVSQPVGEALGAALPAVTKRLFRGGEKGRQGVQKAIDDAAPFGEAPSVAQATKNSFMDSLESLLAKTPGGAGRIRNRVQETTDAVRKGIERVAQQGIGRELDSETAGRAIISGIDDFVGRFKQRAAPLFEAVTDKVGGDTPIALNSTLGAMQDMVTSVKGAERTSARFVSPFVRGLASDLAADAAENGGRVPFAALQRVRSLVGEKLQTPDLTSDVPTAHLKKLYAALSDDIGTAAAQSGDEAARAFKRANKFYKSGLGRIEGTLEPLVRGKVPEKVFESLVRGGKSGGTQIRTVMRSLTPEQQDVVTGTVIRRLGTAMPSQQGSEGVEFSFNTFLTQWNQLDNSAKNALFRRGRNLPLGQDLDALARYAERVRDSSRAFANPSGTSGATIGGTLGLLSAGSVVASPILGAGALTLPLLYGAGAGAANVGARLMTSPRFVHWLAQSTKIKPNGIPAHLARLTAVAQKESPEVQEAISGYLNMLDEPISVAEAEEATAPDVASLLTDPEQMTRAWNNAGRNQDARRSIRQQAWGSLPEPTGQAVRSHLDQNAKSLRTIFPPDHIKRVGTIADGMSIADGTEPGAKISRTSIGIAQFRNWLAKNDPDVAERLMSEALANPDVAAALTESIAVKSPKPGASSLDQYATGKLIRHMERLGAAQ